MHPGNAAAARGSLRRGGGHSGPRLNVKFLTMSCNVMNGPAHGVGEQLQFYPRPRSETAPLNMTQELTFTGAPPFTFSSLL